MLAAFVAIAACTRGPKGEGLTVTARAGAATMLTKEGVSVNIPDGGVPAGTKVGLALAPDPKPTGLLDVLRPLGPEATVTVQGQLAKSATVTFPAPASLSPDTLPPVVVWKDSDVGSQWLPTSWRPGDREVNAETDHFSGGFLAGIDINKWAHERAVAFRDYITGRSAVGQPACGDEAAARSGGVTVTSDNGDRVKWCFGVEGGHRVVKVANNLRTFAQVTYPATWKVVAGLDVSISDDALAPALGVAAVTRTGTASRIVGGGDTLTLEVPDGASGQVTTEISVLAWLASAIQFGAEVYAAVASAAGGAAKPAAMTALDKVKRLLLTGDAGDKSLSAMWACTHDIRDLTDRSENALRDAAKFTWRCVPKVMEAEMTGFGFLAGVVLSLVATVVGLILTAVHLLVTAVREIWDELASLGGQSDAFYDIVVKYPAVLTDSQLRNSTVPAGVCGGGSVGWDQPNPIQLKNGKGEMHDTSGVATGPSIDPAEVVGRADLDGDGRTDVLLSVGCSGGTIAQCCAGRSSNATYAYAVTAGPDGQPKMIGDVIRAASSKPGDQYGPADRNISAIAIDGGGRVVTREYIYYPEQYTSAQVGGVDPAADVAVVHAMRSGRWQVV